MAASTTEIERRRNAALEAICNVHGTITDTHGVTLFVSHHIDELADEFWLKHCGVACPKPSQVLDLLVFKKHWSDENGEVDDDGVDTFDFTLPDDVTDYVVCVEFDANGEVSGVSMES